MVNLTYLIINYYPIWYNQIMKHIQARFIYLNCYFLLYLNIKIQISFHHNQINSTKKYNIHKNIIL
jgi:hypothetical protein